MIRKNKKFSVFHYKNIKLHNILIHYISLKEWSNVIPLLKGKCLDIGCGNRAMEEIIKPYISKYIGLDHPDTLHNKRKADVLGSAHKLPFKNRIFDSIICSAVLEHLEEPDKSIFEMNRILKNKGIAIVSVPLFWHLHEEPRDFYRYTKYGLKYLFKKNGFEIVELKPMSGFWVTFAQEFVYYIQKFRRWGKINPLWWLIPPFGLLIQGIAYVLNIFDNSTEFTWMYLLVAKKINEE